MTYKLNEAKMFADVADGFAIVINSETGVYYGMNPFTSSIFDNMIKGVPIESIVSDVLSMTGAPADFQNKLDELVKGMLEKELIVPGEEKSLPSSVNKDYAIENNFEISWDEFSDAQELLLADPIHEVREEEGWTPDVSSLNPDDEDVSNREGKMKIECRKFR